MCGMMGFAAPLFKTALKAKMGLVGKTVAGKAATAAAGAFGGKAPTATAAGAAAAGSMSAYLQGPKQIPGGALPKKAKVQGNLTVSPGSGKRRGFKGMRPALSLQPSSTLGSGNNSNGGVNIL